ncbi:hypothetical protein B0J12DRAFT_302129 [Macrophomina phaseolina]|uniref:DUF7514 domain-containing protein n=1 Tax=Macrophomina phaseolina TaxID=35725 RepID=A0ABQ8FZY1_9PEZI|nr:hypothetical protein B0J12DRAFT_302129 [Macrophomina phaseolina]
MADHSSTSPDAATKEAQQFWGYLFRPDKCGTDLLNRLLEGIANYVAGHFGPPEDCADITPSQLAGFYKAVGGDYDVLFIDTPAPSVAFIYKSLGCLHSLQPAPDSDGYSIPTIPALKRKGFVTWQTIQLLLGPDEHVPFLQGAVERFDIVDPGTGKVFPKLLPKESFPEKPDEDMLRWYESVSNRLRQECEAEEEKQQRTRPPRPGPPGDHGDRFDSDFSNDEYSADERTGAAAYFRNPLYRNREGRPTIIRRFSRADYKPRSPREFVQDRGRLVANTISRHIWTPWGKNEKDKYKERRKSLPDRPSSAQYSDDGMGEYDDEAGPTPTGLHPRHAHHHGSSSPKPPLPHRPRNGLRRGSSRSYNSATSSDSEDFPRSSERLPGDHRMRQNRNIPLRHRRSHSPPSSPRPHRHTGSDPPLRLSKEHRDRIERPSPREREQHSRDRDRDHDHLERDSARPSPRDPRDHREQFIPSTAATPPTPPPIKTYSGTNLSALAGGGSGSHNSSARPSPSGFKPTNEPLFATQVAHLQPPPTQLGPGGPSVPTGSVQAGQYPRSTYYGDQPVGTQHGRRPSYPPRGVSAAATDPVLLPARAQSVRYPGSASPRWVGSRNSSVEREVPIREPRRDRSGPGHRYVQGIGAGMDGLGGRRYPVEGRY